MNPFTHNTEIPKIPNPFENKMVDFKAIFKTNESFDNTEETNPDLPLVESSKLKFNNKSDPMILSVDKRKNFEKNSGLPELMGIVDRLIKVRK